MTIERQADELIAYLEEELASRCAAQRAKAEEQERQILSQAFHLARHKVSRMVHKEREYLQQQTAKAQTRLGTVERQQDQRRLRLLLEKAREALHRELISRWRQQTVQRRWLQTVLTQACGTLPAASWDIHHGPNWDAEREEEVTAMIPDACQHPPRFLTDPAIEAGIRICSLGAVLDGTVGGLLYDSAAIDARLLAHLHAAEASRKARTDQQSKGNEEK